MRMAPLIATPIGVAPYGKFLACIVTFYYTQSYRRAAGLLDGVEILATTTEGFINYVKEKWEHAAGK